MAPYLPVDKAALLDELREGGFYGSNDLKPMSRKKMCLVICCAVILSPLWLVLLLLWILFVICYSIKIKVNEFQMKTGIVLVGEMLYRAPGKVLDITPSGSARSDILISDDFVDKKGMLNTCKGVSLRKSLEVTVLKDLQKSTFGRQIKGDSDRDTPHYLLHGWTDPLDTKSDQICTEEIWTTHARVASWAAQYSWSAQLPFQYGKFTQAITLQDCPEVLGYIYLIEVSNPEFYAKGSRVVRVQGGANAPEHTPETDGKIFARYGYGLAKHMGNFMPDDPDAYIFKGQVVQDAQLKILHTYRVVKPTTDLRPEGA